MSSKQPGHHHPLSAPGFPSEDLQEAQFRQELQPLPVRRLNLAEHTLRTCANAPELVGGFDKLGKTTDGLSVLTVGFEGHQ